MANRYGSVVMFALEKNVYNIFGQFVFDNGGVISTVANNSKGICNAWQNTPTFSGATSSGSATITSVTSFAGLFTGMQITGASASSTSLTIGTISASTGSVVLSKAAALATSASSSFVAQGGQYIIQFGTNQSLGMLDAYAKLVSVLWNPEMTTGSSSGTLTQAQLMPTDGSGEPTLIGNFTKQRTIPTTLTSASQDCTIVIQFGNGGGTGFVASVPGAGEQWKMHAVFVNSTAP